ncbi:MAG: DHH family phosphoesterase [Lachnospiraceae bacterium]|nr:DHH family phosphoesterase [Lachnospiraceae bacterium]
MASGKNKKEKWYVAAKKADFASIAAGFGIDQVTARLIRNRGIIGMEAIENYLHGGLNNLYDPSLMKGCREAAELILQKIHEKKKIRIIGDYDIDGVCATYILYRSISECGGCVDYEIPDRMKDGYGLNLHLIELAYQEQVDTILTCDNGIAAIDEIAFAKEKGMTVIVTDHHEPLFTDEGEEAAADPAVRISTPGENRIYRLPPADIIVNPHQPGCLYPYKKLCGAAVAWKVVSELGRVNKQTPDGFAATVDELLAFAGFATVGDVMDLDGENRILVKEGLARLRKTKNEGMAALIRANNLEPASITSYHIGFVLGPCINASGRLDTAKRSLRLLLSKTREEAEEIAAKLKELNDERKMLTEQAEKEACALIEAEESYQEDRVLVLYLPNCHESIAGIVAGRLRERYYKPTFVITNAKPQNHSGDSFAEKEACADEDACREAALTDCADGICESPMAKGSGRSIEAYSMFEEMVKVQDLFTKFGGHPMAAGFSLEKERIPEMRRRLNENCTLTEDQLSEKVSIDVPMPINYISGKVVEEISLLEPFGKGNEKPLFADTSLFVVSARVIGRNKNVVKMRAQNRQGYGIDALYFGDPEPLKNYLIEKYGETEVQNLFWGRSNRVKMDFTYYPSINEYMGRRSLQIIIKNYR